MLRTGSGVTYTVTEVGDQERSPAFRAGDSVALRYVIRVRSTAGKYLLP